MHHWYFSLCLCICVSYFPTGLLALYSYCLVGRHTYLCVFESRLICWVIRLECICVCAHMCVRVCACVFECVEIKCLISRDSMHVMGRWERTTFRSQVWHLSQGLSCWLCHFMHSSKHTSLQTILSLPLILP